MSEIKLAKLPKRSPVKLALTISPDLMSALNDYAAVYADTYGVTEPLAELVPAMLQAFLDGDRGFIRARALRGQTS
jgi:hypothetical protein